MPPRTPRTVLNLTTLLALVAAPLAMGFTSPAAAVPSTGLMISAVYGAGGNASATYNADFVELYNASGSAVSLSGKSLQYRSGTGTGNGTPYALPAVSVPSHGYYLVQASTAGTTGANLPVQPDVSLGLNMGGAAGQVFLAGTTAALNPGTGTNIDYSAGKVIDLVGYGASATAVTTYETQPRIGFASSGTNGKAAWRAGPADSDNNSTDFTFGDVSTYTLHNCDCAAPSGLKITEVYTDGGQPGSAYAHDFVELQNTSGGTLSMSGLTLQYRAPGDTGPATVVATLTGSMAANTFDLVQLAGDDANGAALPTPEYTGTLDLAKAGGTLFLAKSTSAYQPGTGAVTSDQYRGDLVGWGASNTFETAAADATDLAEAISVQRANGGVDSGDNSADFTAYAPSPNAQPAIPSRTIPEIQGTGAATPLNNANVAVSGVVTAAYANATGGFNGFYLQTPGYNPAADATPGASDGIFVFTGSSGTFPTPTVGQYVTLASAKVSEFNGMTELTMTNPANITARAATGPEAVTPAAVVPGTDCTATASTTDCLAGAALEAAREAHEGELFWPTAPYTVSDSYDGSPWTQSTGESFKMKGEIGLAANDTSPLMIGTELFNPTQDPAGIAARKVYNEAHKITLDDGNGVDYASTTGTAFPWLTGPGRSLRVGAAVTFTAPVVLDFRNDLWKLQPQSKVPGGSDGTAQGISIEQDRPAGPAPVGGNVRIATFNMLNYFPDDAETWVAQGGDAYPGYPGTTRKCSYYTDRGTDRVTANTCTWTDGREVVAPNVPVTDSAPGPRGAAQKSGGTDLTAPTADFERQQAKEVRAINTMDADVMSLEEVENAVKLGYSDRDRAVKHLVEVLNADWTANHAGEATTTPRWAYAASPRPEAQPTITEQDAIRSAFIYNPRVVDTVGRSQILVNSAPFRNAREPLAQAFKRVGGNRDDGFIVIVNHFKSKGSSTETGDNVDLGDGAGAWNGDRVRQAKALDAFARAISEDKGIASVFLTGDYNAYSHEDPILTLEDAGWHNLEPANGESTYSFGGLAGSLDHVFANEAAMAMVTGQTVWPINANEPVFYEYSRYNYNVTNLYDGTTPFRASDHNPEVIGINAPLNPPVEDVDTVQVLASNDFHGRLLDDPASASAGAAAMAGAVKELRDPVTGNPNTAFVMAGDIVGASTFESFIQKDKPTLDAMNEAGLDVSAAGNHEFDRGYDDLMNRIMASYDADGNPEGGADWPYLAANVRVGDENGPYALDPSRIAGGRTEATFDRSNGATWWKEFPTMAGGAGITVGFVGAVTEDLDSLVAPSALDGIAVTHVVDEVNTAAAELKTDGCGGEPCDLVVELVHEGAPTPDCATIKQATTTTFGRIVHGASADVDAIISGHTHLKYNCKVDVAGKTLPRPVVSAGQYGSYLNQLEFDFAPGTSNLLDIRQHVLAMKDYDQDAATKAIVDDAVTVANVRGAQELGQVAGPFKRARRTDGTTTVENRGGESTLGNLVAEIQREATGADIGVMNPGGLRDDLIGTGNGPGPVTYREAANVQPFANTLVTTKLTGAQVKLLLEQQWQRDPDGNVPSRPFLRLGTSKGLTWTEDSSRPELDRITGVWLNGVAIDPTRTYVVAANSFIASGGDNFRALTLGTDKRDSGVTDLQATVDYLAAHPSVSVDYAQHGVGARVQGGPFVAGDLVTVPVDSLSMTGEGDLTDATVTVSRGAQELGTFPVDSTLPTTPYDVPGTATVSFQLPAGLTGGTQWFTLTGGTTGTVAQVPVQVVDNRVDSTVSGTAADITWGQAGSVEVTVTPATAGGTVELYDGTTKIGEGTLTGDATTIAIAAKALEVGDHSLTLKYLGDAAVRPSQGSVDITVVKASSTVSGTAADITWGQAGSVSVTVTPAAAGGTVEVYDGASKLGEATLADGAATVAIAAKALEVGDHSLTLKYLGDTHHAASQGSVDVTVVKASSSVSGIADEITWGDAGSVNATVTPAAAGGTVELYDGATKLGEATLASGEATVAIAAKALGVGDHSLTLKYLGDAHHAASQGTVSVTVLEATSTVSGTAADVTWGQAGSVAVTVTPAAAGRTVELYDGATKLGEGAVANGTATVAIAAKALAVGNHTLDLKYLGDGGYAPSQATVAVKVVKATATVTATATPASVVQDGGTSNIAVAVTANGVVPTGAVSAWLDGTQLATATLVAGQATLEVGPFATVGTRSIEVRYSGSGDVTAATRTVSVTVTAKPTPQPTATTVSGTDTTVQWAKAGSVTVTVAPAAATGTVELYDGTTRIGQGTLSGGAASIALPARSLEVGTHVLVVKYLGSTSYAASQGVVTVTVTKVRPKVGVDKPSAIDKGDKAKIKVDVSADGFEPTGKVRIVLEKVGSNKSITVNKTLIDGSSVARIEVPGKGRWKVTVTYLGDDHTLRGSDSTHLRVS